MSRLNADVLSQIQGCKRPKWCLSSCIYRKLCKNGRTYAVHCEGVVWSLQRPKPELMKRWTVLLGFRPDFGHKNNVRKRKMGICTQLEKQKQRHLEHQTKQTNILFNRKEISVGPKTSKKLARKKPSNGAWWRKTAGRAGRGLLDPGSSSCSQVRQPKKKRPNRIGVGDGLSLGEGCVERTKYDKMLSWRKNSLIIIFFLSDT